MEEIIERKCKYCNKKLDNLGTNRNKQYCGYSCSDAYAIIRTKIINNIRRRYYAPYIATILEEADIKIERELQKIRDEGN